MASEPFFFSSPIKSTSDLWQCSAPAFSSPQERLSVKQRKHSAFAPTSPSPLRTSRNVNLMSSSLTYGGGNGNKRTEFQGDENESETVMLNMPGSHTTVASLSNQAREYAHSNHFSIAPPPSVFIPASTLDSPFAAIPATTAVASTTTSNSPSSLPATSQSCTATQFQFAARARSNAPSTLLQSHSRDKRDSRKRMFLDRIRTKRDDCRSDRTGDQVLRMDYMRERRQWEEEKARAAGSWWHNTDSHGVNISIDEDGDEDVLAQLEQEGHASQEELSPTEDREIEELAMNYYRIQQQERRQQQAEAEQNNQTRSHDFEMGQDTEEYSDDGYDDAFMEVLCSQVRDHDDHYPSSSIPQQQNHQQLDLPAQNQHAFFRRGDDGTTLLGPVSDQSKFFPGHYQEQHQQQQDAEMDIS